MTLKRNGVAGLTSSISLRAVCFLLPRTEEEERIVRSREDGSIICHWDRKVLLPGTERSRRMGRVG
jgi:hypothetical protein